MAGDVARWTSLFEERERGIVAAMNDDFDTPTAIAELFAAVTEANKGLAEGLAGEAASKGSTLIESYGRDLLGILPSAAADTGGDLVEPLMKVLVELRQDLRRQKNWTTADWLRDRLQALGIAIEDKPEGSTWTRS